MNYKDYNQYQDSMAVVFRDLNDELEKMYAEDECLSLRFLETLNHLLAERMRFCMACSNYWRDVAGRSFWFMKRKCLKIAISYENLHRETLHQRIGVETRIAQIKFNVTKNQK